MYKQAGNVIRGVTVVGRLKVRKTLDTVVVLIKHAWVLSYQKQSGHVDSKKRGTKSAIS